MRALSRLIILTMGTILALVFLLLLVCLGSWTYLVYWKPAGAGAVVVGILGVWSFAAAVMLFLWAIVIEVLGTALKWVFKREDA
jgi:hypothetical protein